MGKKTIKVQPTHVLCLCNTHTHKNTHTRAHTHTKYTLYHLDKRKKMLLIFPSGPLRFTKMKTLRSLNLDLQINTCIETIVFRKGRFNKCSKCCMISKVSATHLLADFQLSIRYRVIATLFAHMPHDILRNVTFPCCEGQIKPVTYEIQFCPPPHLTGKVSRDVTDTTDRE